VVSLQHALRTSDHCSYVNAPAREFETGEARFRLADGHLTCEMKTHFSKVEDARSVVEPILRAWDLERRVNFSNWPPPSIQQSSALGQLGSAVYRFA
jgi:hypothetical protein